MKNENRDLSENARLSRRRFLGFAAGIASAVPFLASCSGKEPEYAAAARELGFPLVDLHVHLDGGITIDRAMELSRSRGVKFGIVEHGGVEGMRNDEDLNAYVDGLKKHPVYIGMQAEGPDWSDNFSREALARLDYVLTDALKFPVKDGRIMRLWMPEEVAISDKREFMDRYVDYHVEILSAQPIDIIANPTYLPAAIADEYDRLWTESRMGRIIDAAVRNGIALEINSRYQVPGPVFVRMALAAGAKFSFGSNFHTEEIGRLDYCIEMARKCGIKKEKMFAPEGANRGSTKT